MQIETLPITRAQDQQPLQNVLSISTAGKNRYLFHFNNVNSLTQWTAGIRLTMFEHATLQEAYTGSLIAGKGKGLNNIRVIMDRTKLKTEDWARVRFGAGTPWRRCWCVITPPDEKDVLKHQRSLKKKSAYDRSTPVLKGDIKFYDTKKTKKAQPIATIKDAYSAYAIYPQSKPLIDQSTLVKVEGTITIHTTPDTTTEGFVFVMPEVHPAVTGFEIMLRWLFPAYDVFALYGRPSRLIADTLDTRSLMFALPQERRYGYLEIFDVATLIHTPGSHSWSEQEWRKRLKELTSERITKIQASGSRPDTRVGSRRGHRNSLPSRTEALRYDDGISRSTPSLHQDIGPIPPPHHTESAPPASGPYQPPKKSLHHQRSVSDSTAFSTPRRQRTVGEGTANFTPSKLSYEAAPPRTSVDSPPPPPPAHGPPVMAAYRNPQVQRYAAETDTGNERSSSESERRYRGSTEAETQNIQRDLLPNAPPAPVAAPPVFAHQPGAKPQTRPYHSPELRRANSRMSITTLSQLAAANGESDVTTATAGGVAGAGAIVAWRENAQQRDGRYSEDQAQGVIDNTSDMSKSRMTANHPTVNEGVVLANDTSSQPTEQHPYAAGPVSPQQLDFPATNADSPPTSPHGFLAPSATTPRSVSPLSQSSTYSPLPTPKENSPAPINRNFSRRTPQRYSPSPQSETIAQQPTEPVVVSQPFPSDQQRPDNLQRTSTNKSITRKPLPSLSNPAVPAVPTGNNSIAPTEGDFAVATMNSSHLPSEGDASVRRPSAGSSEYYNESNDSPDYASTRQSTDTKRSAIEVDKPRAGVLKTVGTIDHAQKEIVVGDVHYRPDDAPSNISSEIPSVDFGPTRIKASGSRNASRASLTPAHGRSLSADNGPPSYPSETPREILRGGHGQSHGSQNRVPSRNLTTPEPSHYRSASDGSNNSSPRTVAWQPGATIGGGSPGSRQSITPEQYVQQRAAASRVTPVYAHGRKSSGPSPGISRHSSGDWLSQIRPAPSVHELPVKPHSRNASAVMNNAADYSAHLSAREQEHVARVTGSPLINMASNPRQAPPGSGLIGAIEAREREKKEIKEGLSGQMVQHAIAQRQQQAQGYSYGQPSPSPQIQSSPLPTPQMHIPGQYPQTPLSSYGGLANQQQQYAQAQVQVQAQQFSPQSWTSPGRQVYWNTAYTVAPHQQQNLQHQQSPQHQQGPYQQGPYQQAQYRQDTEYNPYFANSQGGR